MRKDQRHQRRECRQDSHRVDDVPWVETNLKEENDRLEQARQERQRKGEQ
jgi:hypothetical protein